MRWWMSRRNRQHFCRRRQPTVIRGFDANRVRTAGRRRRQLRRVGHRSGSRRATGSLDGRARRDRARRRNPALWQPGHRWRRECDQQPRAHANLPADDFNAELSGGLDSNADGRGLRGAGQRRKSDRSRCMPTASRAHKDDYDTPEGALANSWRAAAASRVGGSWIGDTAIASAWVWCTTSRTTAFPEKSSSIDMQQTKLLMRSALGLHSGRTEVGDRRWRLGRLCAQRAGSDGAVLCHVQGS